MMLSTQKNSFINRTKVCLDKKYVVDNSPVNYKLGDRINNVRVAQMDWKDRHLSKIKNFYGNSAYFSENWYDVKCLFQSLNENSLSSINKR